MNNEAAFDKAHAALDYIGTAVKAARIMVGLGQDIVDQSAWVAFVATEAAAEIAELMNQES